MSPEAKAESLQAKQRTAQFAASGLSVTTLARKAQLSRNTVKRFLKGASVREDTAQKLQLLMQAGARDLDSMSAPAEGHNDNKVSYDFLERNGKSARNSIELLRASVMTTRQATSQLEHAVYCSISDRKGIPDTVLEALEFEKSKFEHLVTELKGLAKKHGVIEE